MMQPWGSTSSTTSATLAPQGRINEATVRDEIARLSEHWRTGQTNAPDHEARPADILGREQVEGIDLFDRAQLAAVVAVCQECRTLSAAGRKLFSVSRTTKTSGNDADRLRKYLARFGLNFEDVSLTPSPG